MSERTIRDVRMELAAELHSKKAVIGIVGLGYVGLPLALAFTEGGFRVLGFDVDEKKVDDLNAGDSYLLHIDSARIRTATEAGRFGATCDPVRLSEPDVILICVPTPLGPGRDPDLSFVEETAKQLSHVLRRGQLICLESTTYPGTTDEVLLPLLAMSGLEVETDFFLAFSPEREDPGNPTFGTTAVPKVVGGIGAASTELAVSLYEQIFDRVVEVSSCRVAEATKLMENVFRAVNIALVNELKLVYEAMGIDIWEVLDAAETKPFGFMRFNPGPGWGGHCIPVDPFYLSWKARGMGVAAKFIELAGEINRHMPRHVVEKIRDALDARGCSVSRSRIMILGVAYKPNVSDPRESPAFEIMNRLEFLGATLCYHDPFVPCTKKMRSWPHLPPMESVALDEKMISLQDAVVLVTNHDSIDYDFVVSNAALIIDTRGALAKDLPHVVRA